MPVKISQFYWLHVWMEKQLSFSIDHETPATAMTSLWTCVASFSLLLEGQSIILTLKMSDTMVSIDDLYHLKEYVFPLLLNAQVKAYAHF